MADAEGQGTIFDEMKARRSRSDDLNARAIERGLAVHCEESAAPVVEDEAPEVVFAAPDEILDTVEEDAPEEISVVEDVSWEPESMLESIEETASSNFAEEEEPVVEEEIQHESQYFSDIDSLEEDEEFSEPESQMPEPESEVEAVQVPPVSVEQMIVESEDLLGEEPEIDTEAEVTRVAEELVDRIGPIVDIQSLPKTQPSRVLSKTSRPKVESSAESKPKVEEVEATPKGVDYSDTLDEATEVKKKKKKVTLLDSYFKGL